MARKKPKQVVTCRTCKHAHLVRWGDDPIITICKVMKGERFVTSFVKYCNFYNASDFEKEVERRIKDF